MPGSDTPHLHQTVTNPTHSGWNQLIVNKVQTASQQRLKRYEADLARQSKIIEEQAGLISRISDLLWEFQLTLIAPIYYGQPGFRSTQWLALSGANPYEEATKGYLANAGRLLGSVRAEIGAAVRLVPVEQWNTLKNLYYEELLPLDLRVTELIFEGPADENENRWRREHEYILNSFAKVLDKVIDDLAIALDLKYHPELRPVRRDIHATSGRSEGLEPGLTAEDQAPPSS
jgi:hypothetical protein